MIDQDLINRLQLQIDESKDGFAPAYFSNDDIQSLLNSYISLIEQNAELHKELAKSKADYNKLYEICINSGINKNIVDMNMRLGNGQT
jgi:hypothetical protein